MTRSEWVSFFISMSIIMFFGMIASSCAHTPIDKARIATTAASDVGTAAAPIIATWTEQCEASAKKLATVEHKPAEARLASERCKAAFDAMDKAITTYNAGVKALQAGVELAIIQQKFDLGSVLRALLQLGLALKQTLDVYGVQIPGGLGL
jgi:hypothetical protein